MQPKRGRGRPRKFQPSANIVALLKFVQHVLQSLRLLTAVSLSLWIVLLNVGEGDHVRDP